MGGVQKTKTESGSGGKRGHSNMEHWVYTDELKQADRIQRRINDKKASREEIDDLIDDRSRPNKKRFNQNIFLKKLYELN